MMLNIIILSLCASLLAGTQCAKSTQSTQSTQITQSTQTGRATGKKTGGTDVSANNMGQSVEIRYGQEVLVPGHKFKIKFAGVPEDSRCPKGVNCIWAGNVRVLLHVTKAKSKPVKVELNLNPRDFPDGEAANYDNYKLKLISVEPYPVDGQQRTAKDYTVTLDVSKK